LKWENPLTAKQRRLEASVAELNEKVSLQKAEVDLQAGLIEKLQPKT
jgi:hypothetical protein